MEWPVVVKDRISYFCDKKSVAVCFLWTERTNVLPYLEKDNLAIAANLYSHQKGIEPLIRNCLANPCIRYIILMGNKQDGKSLEALKSFFKNGLNEKRQIIGFDDTYIDKNIPIEQINLMRDSIQIFDLTENYNSLEEQIKSTNDLMKKLERKGAYSDPVYFDFEEPETKTFPFEQGPLIIRGRTVIETWIEIIYNIMRYGVENLMDANTDRIVREINNLVAVVYDENPDEPDLSINPLNFTKEQIRFYQGEILSSELPKGKAYTYGNKFREYEVPSYKIDSLLNVDKEKVDFEFKKILGDKRELLIKNTKYIDNVYKINQVKDIIECLKININSKNCVGITWHVEDELVRKHKSSPCAVFIQVLMQNDKINLTVFFRSHDMYNGWPQNAYGFRALQKEIADALGMKMGFMTMISGSAQVYHHVFRLAEQMLEKYRTHENKIYDLRGNYLINLENKRIRVEHVDNRGITLETFFGNTALELVDRIAFIGGSENKRHLMYLGTELMKAELALKNKKEYIQDKELYFSN
jgi:thymidylate synthase